MTQRKFVLVGLLISAAIAGTLSYFASSNPDGLEKVSADKGLDVNVTDSAVADSIFSDYGISGLANSTGLAGIFGVIVTGLLGYGLVKWVSKSSENQSN
jgi:cobalt/nickel transport system permease protein